MELALGLNTLDIEDDERRVRIRAGARMIAGIAGDLRRIRLGIIG